jgi:hypothetical protein
MFSHVGKMMLPVMRYLITFMVIMLSCCGAVVLWCCGAVVLWCCGAVVLWCCGAVVLCYAKQ